MSKVQLECYKLVITTTGDKDDYHSVESFGKFNLNLLKVIKEGFVRDKGDIKSDEASKTYLELSFELEDNSENSSYGLVEYGTFGSGGMLKDAKTGKFKYTRLTTDTEVKPFYFLVEIRKVHQNFYNGFLMIERFGTIGVKKALEAYLKRLVRERDKGVKLSLHPIMPTKLFKKFQQGSLREVRYTLNSLPSNIARHQSISEYEKQSITMELVFKTKKNKEFPSYILNQAKQALTGGDNTKYVTIPGIDKVGIDDYSSTSIKMNLNGSNKTFNLGDFNNLRPYIDINEEVKKDKRNFPIISSINGIATKYLDDLMEDTIV
tara:strand:+ start:13899 stop:14858 length:960 start_codon:yes stop_codon:yes gene_type:complete